MDLPELSDLQEPLDLLVLKALPVIRVYPAHKV